MQKPKRRYRRWGLTWGILLLLQRWWTEQRNIQTMLMWDDCRSEQAVKVKPGARRWAGLPVKDGCSLRIRSWGGDTPQFDKIYFWSVNQRLPLFPLKRHNMNTEINSWPYDHICDKIRCTCCKFFQYSLASFSDQTDTTKTWTLSLKSFSKSVHAHWYHSYGLVFFFLVCLQMFAKLCRQNLG